MPPDRVRRAGVEMRQVLRALAGGDDREAHGPDRVHQLAHQRRLVAIGHGVDHTRLPRPLREQRPGQHVRLHVHHDDVLAVRDRRQRVPQPGGGMAGAFHHHLDARLRHQRHRILDQRRRARRPAERRVERRRAVAFLRPAHARASASRARGIERSAMPATCSPGVRAAMARNMEPNLPAPITPTVTGRPAAPRSGNTTAQIHLLLPGSLGPWILEAAVYRPPAKYGSAMASPPQARPARPARPVIPSAAREPRVRPQPARPRPAGLPTVLDVHPERSEGSVSRPADPGPTRGCFTALSMTEARPPTARGLPP